MIQNELGVTDNAHRKKLELRAMDVVLFGPPRGIYTLSTVHNMYFCIYRCICI